MIKNFLLGIAATVVSCATTFAQKPCNTDTRYSDLVKRHPELEVLQQQIETQVSGQFEQLDGVRNRITALSPNDTTIFDVPIVVHIVHDYSTENLPDTVILQAFANWSDVYMLRNTDSSDVIAPFKRWIGHPRIRLHLATKDPNGNPTKGITRHMSYLTTNADDGAKFDVWPNNKYINIWFIRTFGSSASGAAAYAYLPSMAAFQPEYDGIISLAEYVNIDKTIPHELGHVLNLNHVWGRTNNPDVACGDDNIWDTPPTKGHNPSGCTAAALYDVTCSGGYTHRFTSITGADSIVDYPDTNNSQNIMDYTYCARMFTMGQAYAMRSALNSGTAGRNNLITAANLNATGALAPYPDLAPTADYIVDRGVGSVFATDARTYFLTFNHQDSFNFRNASWNDTVSRVDWLFSNGATHPTASSMNRVLNHFSQPGWVTVTQIATSNAGVDTLVDTHAVYAADTTAISPFGYVQEFDSASCGNWPMFNFYKNNFYWQLYSGASYSGDGKCLRYRSKDNTSRSVGSAVGDHDDIYTPAFNLNGISGGLYLNFRSIAGTTSGGSVGDSMEIDISTNGGARWTKIGGVSGTNLANGPRMAAEFVPTASSIWKAHSISVPASYRTNQTFFRLRYWPGDYGNNCYLDKFTIGAVPEEVTDEIVRSNDIKVYPNPTENGCNVVFGASADATVIVTVKDVTGRQVYSTSTLGQASQYTEIHIEKEVFGAPGMYFVTVTSNGFSATEKLMVK